MIGHHWPSRSYKDPIESVYISIISALISLYLIHKTLMNKIVDNELMIQLILSAVFESSECSAKVPSNLVSMSIIRALISWYLMLILIFVTFHFRSENFRHKLPFPSGRRILQYAKYALRVEVEWKHHVRISWQMVQDSSRALRIEAKNGPPWLTFKTSF